MFYHRNPDDGDDDDDGDNDDDEDDGSASISNQFSLIRWAVTCFRGSRSSYLKRSGLSITQACRKLQPDDS